LCLPGFDCSQPGAYFVTVVTHGRACLFGEVVNGKMCLNDAGRVVVEVLNSLPDRLLKMKTTKQINILRCTPG